MWDKTRGIIEMIRTALEKNPDADDMMVTIVLDKDAAIQLGDELSRFVYRDSVHRKIMRKTNEEPAIRQVTCLYDTVDPMVSKDYKDRFYAEYWQLKIRYEKLKKFNNRIEAAHRTDIPVYPACDEEPKKVEMPEHDCPNELLREQQGIIGEYLHLLEVRAVIEGIDLDQEA